MPPKYEYKFVRLGKSSHIFGIKRKFTQEYQQIVHDHARNGWRLVQIFAPSIGVYGASTFYELIFERELPA